MTPAEAINACTQIELAARAMRRRFEIEHVPTDEECEAMARVVMDSLKTISAMLVFLSCGFVLDQHERQSGGELH